MKGKTLVRIVLLLVAIALLALYPTTGPVKAQCSNESSLTHQVLSDSQSQQKKPVFHHLIIDNGLTDSPAFHALQDRQDFVWVTMVGDGLYRFDPVSEIFTRFSHNQLPDNPMLPPVAPIELKVFATTPPV